MFHISTTLSSGYKLGDVRQKRDRLRKRGGLKLFASLIGIDLSFFNLLMKLITIRILGGQCPSRSNKIHAINGTADMKLLGTHDTGELALQAVHLPLPDVLLIDAHLAGISGMECVALLKQRHPELLVILLTAAENTEELFQCLRVGACGYLIKGLPTAALLAGIRHLYFGGLPMSAGMARQALQFFQMSAPLSPVIEFSRREREVLAMLAQGLRYKEIAVRLSVGVATVRTYLERAYGKLGVTNRTEAVARFMQHSR